MLGRGASEAIGFCAEAADGSAAPQSNSAVSIQRGTIRNPLDTCIVTSRTGLGEVSEGSADALRSIPCPTV